MSIDRYIEQLLDDIRMASWKIKPPHTVWTESNADPDNELELEDISYVEQYLYGQPVPVSSITGIDVEQLPEAEKLSKEQQHLLAVELENLLGLFHFELDFPKTYPANMRYRFIRRFWDEEHVPLSFGTTHIEFCDYDKPECPFPGYCNTCSEMEAQNRYDELHNSEASFDFDTDKILPSSEEIEVFFKKRRNSDPDDNDDSNANELPF